LEGNSLIKEKWHKVFKEAINEDEVLQIVRKLVKTESHWAYEEREKPIANVLKHLFEDEGIDVYLQEVIDGRPNVIATLHGSGGGNSLMFNGHIDTVPPFGMDAPFEAEVKDGKLFGRGSADMKSGVGTMAYALIILHRLGIKLKGDLVFAGVIDEDAAGSAGTRYIVDYGPKTDYAIVGEPTLLHPVTAHKGCDYFEVTFGGKSVHSSVPENGVNAVVAAADFITKVEKILIPEYKNIRHPLVGSPTINVGLVQGSALGNVPFLLGESPTFAGTIPDLCKVYIDVRWTPNQTIEGVTDDIRRIAELVMVDRPDVSIKVDYIPMSRPAMEIDADHKLVETMKGHISSVLGKEQSIRGETYWGDSGLLYGLAGIPTLMFGPGDIGCAHSDNEFIDISQLIPAVLTYLLTAIDVCGVEEK
jgi:acetylornithine deacetylase/succinyl-diaminopimelate desuccinylase family protein